MSDAHHFDERFGADSELSPLDQLAHQSRYLFAGVHARNRSVLDLACGTGYGSKILAQSGAREVTGVDLSEAALEEGQRLHAHERVRLLQGDAFHPPVDGPFDIVVSFETIEHLPSPEELLNVMARLVATDGAFICSTPDRAVSNPGTTKLDRPSNPYHLMELDRAEFRDELRTRFHEVKLYGQIYSLPTGPLRSRPLTKAAERLAYATTWPIRLPLRSLYMVAICRGPR